MLATQSFVWGFAIMSYLKPVNAASRRMRYPKHNIVRWGSDNIIIIFDGQFECPHLRLHLLHPLFSLAVAAGVSPWSFLKARGHPPGSGHTLNERLYCQRLVRLNGDTLVMIPSIFDKGIDISIEGLPNYLKKKRVMLD